MRLIFLFLLTSLSLSLFSLDSPELISISHLIEITKQNAEIQEKIRVELIDYQKINKEFLKNPDDKELLFQMIKKADHLFENIKQAHLTQIFSSDFLKELTLFSQIASKRGIPKP